MSGGWGSFADETSALLAGAGILTLALFPLAIPAIALTVVALVPFLAVGLAFGVLAAPPLLVARRLGRRAKSSRSREGLGALGNPFAGQRRSVGARVRQSRPRCRAGVVERHSIVASLERRPARPDPGSRGALKSDRTMR
jgi:membrane protein implicated in regulation of membrane protease activity